MRIVSDRLVTSSFSFVLLPGVSLLTLAAATEPLRQANSILGHDHYNWSLHSQSGDPVAAWNGMILDVEDGLSGIDPRSIILVCGGMRSRDQGC